MLELTNSAKRIKFAFRNHVNRKRKYGIASSIREVEPLFLVCTLVIIIQMIFANLTAIVT